MVHILEQEAVRGHDTPSRLSPEELVYAKEYVHAEAFGIIMGSWYVYSCMQEPISILSSPDLMTLEG